MNAEGSKLAVQEISRTATITEQLTAHFYAWERRGRGWHVWPEPVDLEPPFQAFLFHRPLGRAAHPLDDGRRPTLGSRVAGLIDGLFKPSTAEGPAPSLWEPFEPEPTPDPGPRELTELQVIVPRAQDVSPEAAERLLVSLPERAGIQSFELVSTPGKITVQFAACTEEADDLKRQLRAYFPEAVIRGEQAFLETRWREARGEAALVDFGLAHEFMLPLRTFRRFTVDPLIALIAALEGLTAGEVGVFQALYRPARNPWAQSMLRAVRLPTGSSRGQGGVAWSSRSFFVDAPHIPELAEEKIERPLFAASVRAAARSPDPARAWEIVRSLTGALGQLERPQSNKLIPLAEVGYPRTALEADLLARRTRRPGMLVNSEELATLVHLPSASVRSATLDRKRRKTRPAPPAATEGDLVLGTNEHAGRSENVRLSDARRLRHTHLIGATGTGKSHLMAQLAIQDFEAGRGVGVLDPHGDLIELILSFVPDHRIDDVCLFDPSDTERPVGFNVLEAHSALERTLLSSDLVGIVRRLSTSWGDRIETILQNAVLAFLSSSEGGTLADLRQFLTDTAFRRRFLLTVTDREARRYFQYEFPRLDARAHGPILTRLNTFLRHPLVRQTVSQRESRLDLGRIMDEGGILLAKLSQGLLGQENSALLGALLVAKIHQHTLARQIGRATERRPFYVYIDEFQHFTTPSMGPMLAGARKYRVGLTLAHQHLSQLQKEDARLAGAVLANPATRLCFRVGDQDARKLAAGYAHFDATDLQALGVGEAIGRVERADWDFNLRTHPLPERGEDQREERRAQVIGRSREVYGTPREQPGTVEDEPPAPPHRAGEREGMPDPRKGLSRPPERAQQDDSPVSVPSDPPLMGRGGRDHRYLQNLIKRWSQGRGWKAQLEAPVLAGAGSVDVALTREEYRLACEISISSSPSREVENIRKCLQAGFDEVVVVAEETHRLERIRTHAAQHFEESELVRVHFLTADALFALLETREAEAHGGEQRMGGYRVNVEYRRMDEAEQSARRNVIAKVITKAIQRLRSDDELSDQG